MRRKRREQRLPTRCGGSSRRDGRASSQPTPGSKRWRPDKLPGRGGSAPEVDTPTTAREGSFQPGPLCDGNAHDGNAHNGLQHLPHRHVEIPGCLLDVARRWCEGCRRIWGGRDMNARGWSPVGSPAYHAVRPETS